MTDLAESLDASTNTFSIPPATDRELITLWVERQDAKSLETIIRRHGRLVHSLTHKLLTSPHDRADAFQTVFLMLSQQAQKIRQRESLAMWIYGVTVRTCLMMSRQRAHAPIPDHVEAPPYPDREVLEHQELILTLNKELHLLPEHLRESLVLVYLEGYSRQVAAELMNTTEQTIKSRLARGRNLLRVRLLKQGVTFTTAFTTFSLMTPSSEAAVVLSEQLIDQTLATCQTGELTGGSFTLPLDPITILPTGAPVMSSTTFYGTLAVTTWLLLTTMGMGNRGKAEGQVASKVVDTADAMQDLNLEKDNVFPHIELNPKIVSAVQETPSEKKGRNLSKPVSQDPLPSQSGVETSRPKMESANLSPDAKLTLAHGRELFFPLGIPTKETKADIYIFPAYPDRSNPMLIAVGENVLAIPHIVNGNQTLVVTHTKAELDRINEAIDMNGNPFVVVPHGFVDIETLSRMMLQKAESSPQRPLVNNSKTASPGIGITGLNVDDEAKLQAYKDQLDGYLVLINQSWAMNARLNTPGYSKEDLYKDWKQSSERARNLLEESLVHLEKVHSDPSLAEKIKEFRQSHYQLARENLKKIRSKYLQRVLDSETIEEDVLKELDIIDDSLADFDRSEARTPLMKEQPSSDAAQLSDDENAKAIQSAYQLQALEYIQNRFSLLQLQTTKEQPHEIKSIQQGLARSLGRQEEALAQLEQQLGAYSEADAAKARRIREIAYDALVTKIENSIRKRNEEDKYPDPRNRQIIEHFQKTIERITQEKTLGDFRAVTELERSYLEPVSFERISENELSNLEEELPDLKKRLHALRRDFGPDIQEARRLANYINFLESQKKFEKTYVKSPDGKTMLLVEPEKLNANEVSQQAEAKLAESQENPYLREALLKEMREQLTREMQQKYPFDKDVETGQVDQIVMLPESYENLSLGYAEQKARADRLEAELARRMEEDTTPKPESQNEAPGESVEKQLQSYQQQAEEYIKNRSVLLQLQISKDQPRFVTQIEDAISLSLNLLEQNLKSIEEKLRTDSDVAADQLTQIRNRAYDSMIAPLTKIIEYHAHQLSETPSDDPRDQQILDHRRQTLKYLIYEKSLGSFDAVSQHIRTDLSAILFKEKPNEKLRKNLLELREDFGPDHPEVKRVEEQLRLREQFEELNGTKSEAPAERSRLDKSKVNIMQSLEEEKNAKTHDNKAQPH